MHILTCHFDFLYCWLLHAAKMIGLPPVFWHEHGIGGGVLQVNERGIVDCTESLFFIEWSQWTII